MTDKRSRAKHLLTVGAMVQKEEQILLVKHRYGPTKGKWDFIRGYVEPNEDTESAAVREVWEECSITAVPLRIVGIRNQLQNLESDGGRSDILLLWLLQYSQGEPVPDRQEVEEARFFQREQIIRMDDVTGWTKAAVSAAAQCSGMLPHPYTPHFLPSDITAWKFYT